MADDLRHTNLLSHQGTVHVAGPCQRKAAAKAGKVMWPYTAEGWQGADATSITPPCALSTAAACLRGCSVCCLFLLQTRAISEESGGALSTGACDRATRTARRTHALHSTP